MEPRLLHPDLTLMKKNPKLAADDTLESLKEFFGPDYNLWADLAELFREIELLGITYNGSIDNGKYVMVLRQELADEWQSAYVKELLTCVFRDLSRMSVEVAFSPRRVILGADLNSISGS